MWTQLLTACGTFATIDDNIFQLENILQVKPILAQMALRRDCRIGGNICVRDARTVVLLLIMRHIHEAGLLHYPL